MMQNTLPEKHFREEQLCRTENTSAQNLNVGEFAARMRRKPSELNFSLMGVREHKTTILFF